ncbi:MAG: O-methyltransferase [Mycobacteriaceae bacterium]
MPIKDRIPFLRWSFWRLAVGLPSVIRTGQVGDGREAAAVRYVLARARAGDIDDVIDTIDRFAYQESILINVGDEKGLLLDAAVRRSDARLALELGTYCGYSALRIARAAPNARVFSVEMTPANADNARRIWAHAGVADRVTCVVGTIGDGGHTLDILAGRGLAAGNLDFLFIDHNKDVYLPDLLSITERGWLHPGSIVVADNVLVPGAPKYRAHMRRHQGGAWDTVEHKTHAEYTKMPDLVLESTYRG